MKQDIFNWLLFDVKRLAKQYKLCFLGPIVKSWHPDPFGLPRSKRCISCHNTSLVVFGCLTSQQQRRALTLGKAGQILLLMADSFHSSTIRSDAPIPSAGIADDLQLPLIICALGCTYTECRDC